jgi:hypothetical protein
LAQTPPFLGLYVAPFFEQILEFVRQGICVLVIYTPTPCRDMIHDIGDCFLGLIDAVWRSQSSEMSNQYDQHSMQGPIQ